MGRAWNFAHKDRFRGYSKRWRQNHPDRYAALNRRTALNRKLKALGIISGSQPHCARCGCNDVRVLEVNHVYGGGDQERRTLNNTNLIQAVVYGQRPVDGLEVLCSACNGIDFIERKYPDLHGRLRVVWSGGENPCP